MSDFDSNPFADPDLNNPFKVSAGPRPWPALGVAVAAEALPGGSQRHRPRHQPGGSHPAADWLDREPGPERSGAGVTATSPAGAAGRGAGAGRPGRPGLGLSWGPGTGAACR